MLSLIGEKLLEIDVFAERAWLVLADFANYPHGRARQERSRGSSSFSQTKVFEKPRDVFEAPRDFNRLRFSKSVLDSSFSIPRRLDEFRERQRVPSARSGTTGLSHKPPLYPLAGTDDPVRIFDNSTGFASKCCASCMAPLSMRIRSSTYPASSECVSTLNKSKSSTRNARAILRRIVVVPPETPDSTLQIVAMLHPATSASLRTENPRSIRRTWIRAPT